MNWVVELRDGAIQTYKVIGPFASEASANEFISGIRLPADHDAIATPLDTPRGRDFTTKD